MKPLVKKILLGLVAIVFAYFIYTTCRPKIMTESFKTKYRGCVKNQFKTIPTEYQNLYQYEDVPFIKKEPAKVETKIDVHDSSIQKGHSLKYSKETNSTQNEVDILQYTQNDKDVQVVLEKIQKRNSPMVLYNMEPEMSVINQTFKQGDTNVKNQVITILREIGREGLMCPTGVVTRIREAAFINEPEKLPVTENMLQQQMLTKAAALNNTFQDYRKTKQALLDEYSEMYPRDKIQKIIDEWDL